MNVTNTINTDSFREELNIYNSIKTDFTDKILYQIISMCGKIHNFDVNETFETIKSMNDNSTQNTTITTAFEPIKKKRGRPKKVKTNTVSNSYLSGGSTDPIVAKLVSALNSNKSTEEKKEVKEEITFEDELKPETPIEEDDCLDTTLLLHKGVEYLLSSDNDLYENVGTNDYVGKWDPNTETIISC